MVIIKRVPSLIFPSVLTFLSLNLKQGVHANSTCPKNCMPYLGDIHCNKTTGICLTGCNTGFYGNNCECTCHCGGGACVREDGMCMETSSAKPIQVCPEQQTEDCQTSGYLTGIGVLLLILIAVIGILVFAFKRFNQRSKQQQSHGPEDRPMLSGNGPSQPPYQVSQMTKSEKDKLFDDLGRLGVLVLYHEDNPSEPVILFCVHMKYDSSRVNTSKNHVNENRYLVNEKASESREESSERFQHFQGTTCLSPAYQGDCPTYWEVHCYVKLEQKLQSGTLLLCIGLCREADRDVSFQIPSKPHCYKLNVGLCDKHEGICTKIYRHDEKYPSSDEPTGISNSEGGAIKYGVLVWKGEKVIMFFDLMNKKLLGILKNVNFEKPLWPMFGVFNRSDSFHVNMKLETTRYIEMSPKKKSMILGAMSHLK